MLELVKPDFQWQDPNMASNQHETIPLPSPSVFAVVVDIPSDRHRRLSLALLRLSPGPDRPNTNIHMGHILGRHGAVEHESVQPGSRRVPHRRARDGATYRRVCRAEPGDRRRRCLRKATAAAVGVVRAARAAPGPLRGGRRDGARERRLRVLQRARAGGRVPRGGERGGAVRGGFCDVCCFRCRRRRRRRPRRRRRRGQGCSSMVGGGRVRDDAGRVGGGRHGGRGALPRRDDADGGAGRAELRVRWMAARAVR
ncbi:hypothetical protein DFJ73DRAFT_957416 [Zopfochytrium polystomum]|nr:hypothetical protein DFJ73DRAFT_957416 [Zopfochytrium polystomum]